MEILGIGPLELFFIVIIALIILGPKDMVKAGKSIGRFLRKLVTSSSWRSIQQASNELKHLPNKLMSEAGLDEIEKDLGINQINKEFKEIQHDISDWTTPLPVSKSEISENKNTAEIITASNSVSDNNLPDQSTPNT